MRKTSQCQKFDWLDLPRTQNPPYHLQKILFSHSVLLKNVSENTTRFMHDILNYTKLKVFRMSEIYEMSIFHMSNFVFIILRSLHALNVQVYNIQYLIKNRKCDRVSD